MTETQEDLAKMEDAGLFAQGNSATLLMSRTGQGKSSLIATLARFVKREYNKVTLVYMFDGGGYPMEVQTLVLSGVIRLFRARTRDPYNQGLMWDTAIKACQGFWPTQINPRRGEVPPNVAMMAPVATEFVIKCPSGHVYMRTTNSQGVPGGQCPTCQMPVGPINWVVETHSTRPKFFEDVGAVAYDSLTQMLNWAEEDLGGRSGRGDIGGLEGAIGGKIISGDQKLGQTTMSHVGFVQQQARSLVLMSNGIPGLVVPPIFTALTLEAVAEGMRVAGPELSGKKKTPTAGAWFGNVLEPEKKLIGNDNLGRAQYQYLLHLEQWVDSDGVIHLCKNRAAPGLLPAVYADPPLTNSDKDKQTAFTEFSLGKFFTALADALQVQTTAALSEFKTTLVPDELSTFEAPATAAPGAPPPGSGPQAWGAPAGMTFAPAPGVGTPVGAGGGFVPAGPAPFATLPGSGPAAPAPFAAPAAPNATPGPVPAQIGGPAAPQAAPVAPQAPPAPQGFQPPPPPPAAAPVAPVVPVLQQAPLSAPGALTPPPPKAPVTAPVAPPAGPAAAPFAPAAPFQAVAPLAPGQKPPAIAPPAGRQAPGVTTL